MIAQADGASQVVETSETNNTRLSAPIKVGPDLVVTAVSVPASAAPGGTIAVTLMSSDMCKLYAALAQIDRRK